MLREVINQQQLELLLEFLVEIVARFEPADVRGLVVHLGQVDREEIIG